MPLVYTETYPRKLLDLNPSMKCVLVESHEKRAGGPATVEMRGRESSIPLTLRNNFSSTGYFVSDTEARDIRLIEDEFQIINHNLRMGVTVCLPTLLLSEELNYLEKHSPKVEQYLLKRLNLAKEGFPLIGL
tara:strand:- start:1643 stop:2038 length:396 start_codon:yes stop_codon:yes gene_type:complete